MRAWSNGNARVWCLSCGVGMQTPLHVCASRTHEFPAKMLHSTPSHHLAFEFESKKIVDIHNLVHRVQYMTIDSIAVRERLTTMFLDITHARIQPTAQT